MLRVTAKFLTGGAGVSRRPGRPGGGAARFAEVRLVRRVEIEEELAQPGHRNVDAPDALSGRWRHRNLLGGWLPRRCGVNPGPGQAGRLAEQLVVRSEDRAELGQVLVVAVVVALQALVDAVLDQG